MSIPSVLQSGVSNESQDLTINTEVLEPNVLNAVQAVFVLPKKGSVLDSKSALKFRVNWSGYVAGNATDVGGKLLSGVLGAIQNARLYASGQLISELRRAGEKVHLDNQFKSQEYKEQYCDVKHASCSGFNIAEDTAESGVNGAISSSDRYDNRAAAVMNTYNKPYFRGIGTNAEKNGLEAFVLLEELFPMLKDIQLPVRFLKDEIRIEIDWNQTKEDWLYVARDAGAPVADLTLATIDNCVLFLDYITYNNEIDSALGEQLATTGVQIPFRQTAVITRTLAGAAGAGEITEDVLLGQEGRAVMKVWVAKKYANNTTDTITSALGAIAVAENPCYTLQGVCRSDRLRSEKFNLIVNDLLILDRDCENVHEAYAYFSEAGEAQASTFPMAWEDNTAVAGGNMTTAVTTDVLFNTSQAAGEDQNILGRNRAADAVACPGKWETGMWGGQNWCGFNIGQGYGSGLNPANALRIGATPIIFRLKRTADGANVLQKLNSPVQIVCFVEYLRLFDLRAGDVSVRDL